MSFFSKLIRIAREIVESVRNQVLGQVNVIEERIMDAVVKLALQAVLGGVWKGRGADEFVRTLQDEVTPKISLITGHLRTHAQRIQMALDIMDDADSRALSEARRLADVLERI